MIDLGSEKLYEVKFNNKMYSLREPTVKDASEFQKNQKDSKGDEIGVFINFISTLGMPKEVAENLGLSKIKTLTDAIMGDLEKK